MLRFCSALRRTDESETKQTSTATNAAVCSRRNYVQPRSRKMRSKIGSGIPSSQSRMYPAAPACLIRSFSFIELNSVPYDLATGAGSRYFLLRPAFSQCFLVNDAFRQFAELFIGLAFFIERLLQKLGCIIFGEQIRECPHRTIGGNFVMLDALGGGNQSGVDNRFVALLFQHFRAFLD